MLQLRIVCPEKVIFQGEAESIKVPGIMGSFEVLENHAPIISSLIAGTIEYKTGQGRNSMDIQGGFIEVKQNEVDLCIET